MSARQGRKRRTASCVLRVSARLLWMHRQSFTVKYTKIVCLKLCIPHSVTTERPLQVKVVKVKKSDKGDFYKRQQTWELRDLTEVDAKDASKVRMTMVCFIIIVLFCFL